MQFKIRTIIVIFGLLTALHVFAIPAPATAQRVDQAEQAFAYAYIAAIKSRDPAKVKALFHPAVIACINDDNRDYFEFVVLDELSFGAKLGANYEIESFKPLSAPPPNGFLPEYGFSYPVPPTHQLHIDAETGGQSIAIIRFVAFVDGKLFNVEPCPNAKGLVFFREQQAEGEKQRVRAVDLVSKMTDPLLSEIRQLLSQNRWLDAMSRYKDATGSDMAVAATVIEVVQQQNLGSPAGTR
jgi:hypothetical protein